MRFFLNCSLTFEPPGIWKWSFKMDDAELTESIGKKYQREILRL